MTLFRTIHRNDDPPDEPDPPCDVCCLPPDECICPACPFCGERGRLACYTAGEGYSLSLTRDQAVARIRARSRAYSDAAHREAAYADWLESTDGVEVSPHPDDYPTTI